MIEVDCRNTTVFDEYVGPDRRERANSSRVQQAPGSSWFWSDSSKEDWKAL